VRREGIADQALARTIRGAVTSRPGSSGYLPLARPAVVVVSILLFMGYWNNFLGPAIYINSYQWKTLPLAVAASNPSTAPTPRC
jgi:multiple sugar transport system permease protein